VLPPGLYEAVITGVDETTLNPDLVHGRYLFRLEARTLNDIRALGTNDVEDDRRFATVARLSEVNQGLYRTLVAPAIRASVPAPAAEALRELHPNRLRFAMFSDRNPWMQPVQAMAESVRKARQPVAADNPLLAMEQAASTWLTTCLESYGAFRDLMTEMVFLNTYGSPVLQALVGLGAEPSAPPRHIERDLAREAAQARLQADLEHSFESGRVEEAVLRALIYIRLADGSVDERGFAVLKQIRASRPASRRISLARFKEMMKEQFLLVSLDEERAVQALPRLLESDAAERRAALDVLHRVLAARGALSDEAARRLARVEALFAAGPEPTPRKEAAHA
jgi:hypothetical protein